MLMQVTETGTVVSVEAGRAAVRIRSERSDACRSCCACQALAKGEFLLWVPGDGLEAGDEVTVAVPLPSAWRGIALVFAVPLAVGLAGLVAGSVWTGLQQALGLGPEPTGLILGGGLALAAFLAARAEDRRFDLTHQPHVIEVRKPR